MKRTMNEITDTSDHAWINKSYGTYCTKCHVDWSDICLSCMQRSDGVYSRGGGYYFYGGHRMHATCTPPHELIQELKKKLLTIAKLWIIFRDEYNPDGPGADEMNGMLVEEMKKNDDDAMIGLKIEKDEKNG